MKPPPTSFLFLLFLVYRFFSIHQSDSNTLQLCNPVISFSFPSAKKNAYDTPFPYHLFIYLLLLDLLDFTHLSIFIYHSIVVYILMCHGFDEVDLEIRWRPFLYCGSVLITVVTGLSLIKHIYKYMYSV